MNHDHSNHHAHSHLNNHRPNRLNNHRHDRRYSLSEKHTLILFQDM